MEYKGKSRLGLQSFEKCPRCGKSSMVFDSASGEQICTNCGYVVKEKIESLGPEWRTFAKEEGGADRIRTGMPSSLALHDMGLATVIGAENRDASGRALESSMKTTLERLRTWDKRSQVHESVDRNLRQAFGELSRGRRETGRRSPNRDMAATFVRAKKRAATLRSVQLSCFFPRVHAKRAPHARRRGQHWSGPGRTGRSRFSRAVRRSFWCGRNLP